MRFPQNNVLVDTHCHLHAQQFSAADIPGVLQRAQTSGIEEIWLVSVDNKSIESNYQLVKKFQSDYKPTLRLGIGFDPEILLPGSDLYSTDVKSSIGENLRDWISKINSEGLQVDLIGEIGLDHYWLSKNEDLTPVEVERIKRQMQEMFITQLVVASELNLPVSIHSRGAEEECLNIVQDLIASGHRLSGVFHSFTGSGEQMRRAISLGFKIGLNGIITYRSADGMRAAVIDIVKPTLEVELSDIYEAGFVLETDAPYLVPSNSIYMANNEPGNVSKVAEFLLKFLRPAK